MGLSILLVELEAQEFLVVDFSFGPHALPNFLSQQIIEIDSEQVLECKLIIEKQITDPCQSKSPLTITEFFESIGMAIGNVDCGPDGCRCNRAVHLDVAYDLQHGYPTRLIRVARNDWKTFPWPSLLFFSVCKWLGEPPPSEVTISLTPL